MQTSVPHVCRHLEFLKTQREICLVLFLTGDRKLWNSTSQDSVWIENHSFPVSGGNWLSHEEKYVPLLLWVKTFFSKPSPPAPLDIFLWLDPLVPSGNEKTQGKTGETLLVIGRFLRHHNGSCNYCTWCFSSLTISGGSGGCGRRETLTWWERRQDGPGGDGFCHHWRHKRKIKWKSHPCKSSLLAFVFLFC